ncbi:MAG: vWA domain-containing protein [Dysgonomonas sp.]|nr:vWA domain-containing protein [Dysgonomonas sp.]
MKKVLLISSMLFVCLAMSSSCNSATSRNNVQNETPAVETEREVDNKPATTKIQVAILLDTSSSMDGLIEQTKARLWNIVNTLTTLKYKGRTPYIEIALYEYGNNGINTDDYIRQITPLTTDLDILSQRLFALTTWGGSEYCGAVIDKAVKKLDWGNNPSDMKLIYIAGNEPFTQGNISYKTAISRALEKNIYVNTIHCGNAREGISGMWKDGATRGKGKFFNIDHNARVLHVDTPYDARISECNERLNSTYVGYGSQGYERVQNQMVQDRNAKSISGANYAERAVSKTKKVYNNSSWDLVDKVKEDSKALDKIEQSELPKEYQNKSKAEIQKLISEKEAERTTIQKEINELAKKRQEYIDEELKKKNSGTGDDLGKAINESILALANQKGYEVSK